MSDNGDDGDSVSWARRNRFRIWGALSLFLFVGVIGAGISQGVLPNVFKGFMNPVVAISTGVVTLLGVVVYGAYRTGFLGSSGFQFEDKTEKQLSSRECEELVKYELWHSNVFVKKVLEAGIVYEGDEDEEARVFMMDFLDRSHDRRGVVVSLEQDIDFELDYIRDHDFDRVDEAVEQINNIRRFRSDRVDSMDAKFESVISDMANTVQSGIVREEIDPETGQVTGRVTRNNVRTEVNENVESQ